MNYGFTYQETISVIEKRQTNVYTKLCYNKHIATL